MVKPTIFAELETMGDAQVRHMLAMGKCGVVGSDHRVAVESWLEGKEREREAAHNAETLATAKDAAASAKVAASAAVAAAAAATASALSAVEATTLARQAKIISITFAVISTIVSVIALFLKK